MANFTTNFNLKKPLGTEVYNIEDDNGNMDLLDTALTNKAPLASPTFTGTVAGVTKTMVGLSSVDNTADTAKPVSTAQQTALNLKANLASPTFTGTVTAPTNTAYTTRQVRNVVLSTADASGGSNGDIWFKYTP